MPVKKSINNFLIISIGLIIVICSALIYIYILRGVFGNFGSASLIPESRVIQKVMYGEKTSVAVLYSKYTENMLPEGSTWINDNITTWKKFLSISKTTFDIISDEDVELGKHFNYSMLVLPGTKSLSDREIIQIKKYLDQGGSIFATSGIASYSSDGKWRGWDFFSEIFGVEFTKEIEKDEITKIHTLRGGLPITANIPSGYPLKVATWDRPMAAKVLDPRTVQASFWYNYRLEDGLVREAIKESAGIIFGTYGLGRFVWMGFEINSIIGVQEDYIFFDRLFNNCINWLKYEPIALVKDWPSGYEAAAVIMPSVTGQPDKLNNLLPILKSENVKASFFIDPFLAEENKTLLQNLTKHGEIGAIIDIGYLSSVNDTVNSLNDFDLQTEKLLNAKALIEAAAGTKVNGAVPYYGLYDPNTIQALINAGYKYVLTDSLTDRSVPKAIVKGNDMIVSMTKTARDDYEIIRDFGLVNTDFQRYTYQEDIDRVYFEGGMYLLKLHPEYQLTGDNISVVKDLIKDLKAKKFWIATASEITNWWSRRNYVELRVERRGEKRISLTVSNPGVNTVSSLIVEVYINDDAYGISLSSEIIGTRKANYKYDNVSKILYVYIEGLAKGESRTYYIDYNKPNI
jgi:peptidoglycan/xylan/chitin deacetylase (PgdA/CDA1 family)